MLYNLLLKCIILPLGDLCIGASFSRQLTMIRRQSQLNEKELREIQREKLSKVLHFAVGASEYYKRMDIQLDLDPEVSIKRFPILNKADIRSSTDKMLTSKKKNLIERKSSGSSGMQTTVYINKKEESTHRAYQVFWWELAGYKLGDPILQTGITPDRGIVKRVKDVLLRTHYMVAFSPQPEDEENAFAWLGRKRRAFIGGYASSLYMLAKSAKKYELKEDVNAIVAWGDKLFPHYRKLIEGVFHANLYETYGSSEGFMMGAQKDLPYMYHMSPHTYIEIVDDAGNDVEDGELGHVIVTNLDHYAMPMIRYRIGDLAIKLPRDKYPEERELNFPILQKVIGRDTDIVKTRSGRYMVVHTFTGIFEHYPQIEQFCVVQNNLDGIVIKYIPAEGCGVGVLDEIKRALISKLNDSDFVIQFEKVNVIPPTKSGKPQIIKSSL